MRVIKKNKILVLVLTILVIIGVLTYLINIRKDNLFLDLVLKEYYDNFLLMKIYGVIVDKKNDELNHGIETLYIKCNKDTTELELHWDLSGLYNKANINDSIKKDSLSNCVILLKKDYKVDTFYLNLQQDSNNKK